MTLWIVINSNPELKDPRGRLANPIQAPEHSALGYGLDLLLPWKRYLDSIPVLASIILQGTLILWITRARFRVLLGLLPVIHHLATQGVSSLLRLLPMYKAKLLLIGVTVAIPIVSMKMTEIKICTRPPAK